MYDAPKLEKKIHSFWEKEKIHKKVKESKKDAEKFYFCDGPPYATGQIHPGTAWNKCVKDAVCRYKRARGFNVRDQAGFDTHGLPIEVKVEQELKLKSKKDIQKIGVAKFIKKCREFATKYIGVMSKQFKGLGCWLDFEDYYVTYKNSYIEAVWSTIKKAQEKQLLERGVYVLPFCPRCETAIANYELEYDERVDPSIYVKFKILGREKEYLVIWTTTPWTLVGNIAVMVHPNYQYVKVKVEDENWIVAKDRLNAVVAVTNKLGLSSVILEEFSGLKLDGLRYVHPLLGKVPKHKEFKDAHRVVMSDKFVTLEDGSGLVHCAPGHGPQDFEVGKQYNLPIFCPVGENGRYTKDAGDYAGMYVKEADKLIIEELDKKGLLIHAGDIRHRYPHCWRCKSSLIFITTDQWFIRITKMKEKMLAELEKVRWQPEFARVWFKDFITYAPDWCISRQRYWGIPLPIWECSKCKKIKVISSRTELEIESGKRLEDLHKPEIDEVFLKCECGGEMRRVPDVLDVWFDSGNAIWAPLTKEELKKWYPCDFIVEGKDQIRGWFYSLLGCGVITHDEIPYRNLLMHGFFVDEKGEKMSKSLGNFVPLEEITEKYGVDTFRLWSMSSTVWEDLKFNWEEIKGANKSLSILWNMYLFTDRFSKLSKFDPKKHVKEYEPEDLWLLSRLNGMIKQTTAQLDNYELHEAVRLYRNFMVEDLSRFYLKLGKKRLADGRNTDAFFKTLHTCMLALTKLLTPITPFIAEEGYQLLFRESEGKESVSMLPWPEHDHTAINPLLEKQMEICREIGGVVAQIRQNANVKLRWPLEEVVVVTDSIEHRNGVERLPYIIEIMSNVKKVRIQEDMPTVLEAKTKLNLMGPAFREYAAAVAEAVKKSDARLVRKELEEKKTFEVMVNEISYKVTPDMVEFSETPPKGYAEAPFSGGRVFLKKDVTPALYEEAIAREVARRIQMMRKELQLVETDLIKVNVIADAELLSILKKNEQALAKEVKAKSLILSEKQKLKGKAKEWEIEDSEVKIVIVK
ncbi:MAG: Isoleucyl-tRNA synthetase [Candidatus Fermentimicrarchaeum limneticum]|uniref:Isoleucine--tRNA ligase n=1 Tax=Fermentimicrarchaeum limneticum TaxID=2795018 RepID=A0A7D6BKT4_FERL1|nr:MAG: Isoleucyl-tRNA synthetase [Candidatus Fermentimicrarchaeum limneticum]